MPFAASNGARIYYESRGSGPPLLLVPGVPMVASDWFPFADPLTERWATIVYDNRGTGRSDSPEGPYSTAELAADAVAALDAAGVERAHVFGASMGGMIAQELALGWPDRVDRLVLGCTQASTRAAVHPRREVSLAFEIDDWGERIRALAPFAFAPDVDPRILEAFIAAKSQDVQPEQGYRGQVAAFVSHDALDRLAWIDAPTLVLTGDQDAVIPPENSHVLCEGILSARLEVIADAGHLFFIERPGETLAALEPFLSQS
jgi:pimeloyl-ACP methyl ester carboxylesterase